MRRWIAVIAAMLPISVVQAHAGLVEGGSLLDGFVHLFSSGDHLLLLLALVAVIGLWMGGAGVRRENR